MVKNLDDDCNIEFHEFLQLVKGGNKTKKKVLDGASDKYKATAAANQQDEDGDVIFNFFKKLTDGELQPDEDMKIGFGVFYSSERRKKILSSILNVGDKKQKAENHRLLSNYRTQLSNHMKRVKDDAVER